MEDDYKNPALPGSFGGIDKFKRAYKSRGHDADTKQVKQALEHIDSYSIYKQARRKFRTRPVVPFTIDHIWDMDLLSIPQDMVAANDGYKFILGAIDIFSRYVWTVPLLSKQAAVVLHGVENLLASTDRSPDIIRSDRGKEFMNRQLGDYLKKIKIDNINNSMLHKANFIERFWRTLRVRIHRYLTEENTNRFIDKLPDFISSYNSTFHRSIGMAPADVNHDNELELYEKQKAKGDKYLNDDIDYKFQVGDMVRISHLSRPFMRSFDQQHTPEVFTIAKHYKRQGLPIYEIKDCAEKLIEGKFYAEELTRVRKDPDVAWPIERVYRNKKRKINGKLHYLVSWKGYPRTCDSYVPVEDIKNV